MLLMTEHLGILKINTALEFRTTSTPLAATGCCVLPHTLRSGGLKVIETIICFHFYTRKLDLLPCSWKFVKI